MKTLSAIVLTLLVARGAASPAPFTAPQAHPISRYEAGWQKNPFTLKTAPIVITKDSFAKDIALAGWRQSGDDSIIKLVNTKTREYSSLKNQEPGPDGTVVKTAHLENRHADTFVELERNGETAVVRYDEGFLKQMAAQGAAAKPNPQVAMRAPSAAGQNLPPGLNTNPGTGMQHQSTNAPNITPPGVQTARPAIVPPVATPQTLPPGGLPALNPPPTIQRRRLNTMPQPVQR
jgi:hypothetical protein